MIHAALVFPSEITVQQSSSFERNCMIIKAISFQHDEVQVAIFYHRVHICSGKHSVHHLKNEEWLNNIVLTVCKSRGFNVLNLTLICIELAHTS